MFEKFDGIWKTWRPELREKIYSRDYTIGYDVQQARYLA